MAKPDDTNTRRPIDPKPSLFSMADVVAEMREEAKPDADDDLAHRIELADGLDTQFSGLPDLGINTDAFVKETAVEGTKFRMYLHDGRCIDVDVIDDDVYHISMSHEDNMKVANREDAIRFIVKTARLGPTKPK